MVQYLCNRCGYTTNYKCNFINHLKRKNACLPIQEDVSIENVAYQYNIEICEKSPPKYHQKPPKFPPKTTKNHQNSTEDHQNTTKNHQNESQRTCTYCNKEFSRVDSLTRHLSRCKKKKHEDTQKNLELKEIKKAYEELKNQVEDMLIESSKAIAVTNTHNTNTINTNNTNNIKNTTNIHINNYGFENVKYLKKNYLNNLVHGVFTAIPRLIKKIHFNDKHPENQNIKITNKKEPYIRVRQNNEWLLKNKKEILEDLIDCKYMILSQHCDDFEEEIPNGDVEKMNDFRKRYNGEEKNLMKDLLEQAELALLNYSKK